MFSQHAKEVLASYVYALFDPAEPALPFYIGKGTGDRVFNHVTSVDMRLEADDIMTLKEDTIKRIKQRGQSVSHKIIRFGMTHAEALKVEASLIDMVNLIRPGLLTNAINGQGVAEGIYETDDLRAVLNAEPLETTEALLILKIEKAWSALLEYKGSISAITHEELFQAVRGDWRIDVGHAEETKAVLVVARGLVRDVVVPAGWGRPLTNPDKKWMTGELDASAYRPLVGKSVAHLFTAGTQTAIRYVNDPRRPVQTGQPATMEG